jgi:membrane-associated phospholipid phosphatase
LRRLLALGALLAATAVSVAMVALKRHFFTDIIGGAAVATAVVLLTAFGLDWLGARQRPRHGAAPDAPPGPERSDTVHAAR